MLRHNIRTVARPLFQGIKTRRSQGWYSSASDTNWIQPPIALDTGIKVYNCVARTAVPLVFPNNQLVTWYTCGPTVYDSSHIGHASCYVKLDIIQRILRDHFNINLVTAMNITDVDDKIINKSNATKEPWQQLAKRYEAEFWNDMDSLGVCRPDIILRVTERIPEIIDFVRKLLDQESAYIGRDGSVYFANQRTTGKLQNIGEVNAEVPATETDSIKKSPSDFALWKAAKPEEPSWDVPWTLGDIKLEGRPGWHTECSAMASKLFGRAVDIHGGGMDLKFPHHENEENQCCTYHNTPQWVNYWLHTGQLHCDDINKMSKSLKNTISIESLLDKFTSNQFRVACLLSNYRNKMHYNDEAMLTACNVLKRITTFTNDSLVYLQNASSVNVDRSGLLNKINETTEKINHSLKDDLNTSKSIEHLLDLISFANKNISVTSKESRNNEMDGADAILAVRNLVIKQLNVFGCVEQNQGASLATGQTVNSTNLINIIVKVRENIRNKALNCKDEELFHICNDIRQTLGQNGVELKDLPKGADGVSKSSWSLKVPEVSRNIQENIAKKESKKNNQRQNKTKK